MGQAENSLAALLSEAQGVAQRGANASPVAERGDSFADVLAGMQPDETQAAAAPNPERESAAAATGRTVPPADAEEGGQRPLRLVAPHFLSVPGAAIVKAETLAERGLPALQAPAEPEGAVADAGAAAQALPGEQTARPAGEAQPGVRNAFGRRTEKQAHPLGVARPFHDDAFSPPASPRAAFASAQEEISGAPSDTVEGAAQQEAEEAPSREEAHLEQVTPSGFSFVVEGGIALPTDTATVASAEADEVTDAGAETVTTAPAAAGAGTGAGPGAAQAVAPQGAATPAAQAATVSEDATVAADVKAAAASPLPSASKPQGPELQSARKEGMPALELPSEVEDGIEMEVTVPRATMTAAANGYGFLAPGDGVEFAEVGPVEQAGAARAQTVAAQHRPVGAPSNPAARVESDQPVAATASETPEPAAVAAKAEIFREPAPATVATTRTAPETPATADSKAAEAGSQPVQHAGHRREVAVDAAPVTSRPLPEATQQNPAPAASPAVDTMARVIAEGGKGEAGAATGGAVEAAAASGAGASRTIAGGAEAPAATGRADAAPGVVAARSAKGDEADASQNTVAPASETPANGAAAGEARPAAAATAIPAATDTAPAATNTAPAGMNRTPAATDANPARALSGTAPSQAATVATAAATPAAQTVVQDAAPEARRWFTGLRPAAAEPVPAAVPLETAAAAPEVAMAAAPEAAPAAPVDAAQTSSSAAPAAAAPSGPQPQPEQQIGFASGGLVYAASARPLQKPQATAQGDGTQLTQPRMEAANPEANLEILQSEPAQQPAAEETVPRTHTAEGEKVTAEGPVPAGARGVAGAGNAAGGKEEEASAAIPASPEPAREAVAPEAAPREAAPAAAESAHRAPAVTGAAANKVTARTGENSPEGGKPVVETEVAGPPPTAAEKQAPLERSFAVRRSRTVHEAQNAAPSTTEQGAAGGAEGVTERGTGKIAAPAAATTKVEGAVGTLAEARGGSGDKKGGDETGGQAQQQAALQTSATKAPDATQVTEPEQKSADPQNALRESILAQVKDGAVTRDAEGNREISIRLNPEELGELKIQVRMEENRLRVEVVTDNPAVKELLLSNLDSLRQALSSKSFSMEGFNVSTGGAFGQLPEDRKDQRQQPAPRNPRLGRYGAGSEIPRVNYLTGGDNTLLDVRA